MKHLLLISVMIGLAACGQKNQMASISLQEQGHSLVLNADDRHQADHSHWISRRVLYFDVGCTATLVGPRLALTAAHCVEPLVGMVNGKLGSLRESYVYAGYVSSKKFDAYARIVNVVWGSFKVKAHDWALLELDKPLGEAFGYFEVAERTPESLVGRPMLINVGFPGDKSWMSYQQGCTITKFYTEEARLFHNCDTAGGASGSALLACTEKKCQVVGIHVSGAPEVNTNLGTNAAKFYKAVLQGLEKEQTRPE